MVRGSNGIIFSLTILVLVVLTIGNVTAAAAPAIEWQKVLGGSAEEYGNYIQQTGDGGYIMTVRTSSNDNGDVGLNHGFWDVWVVKLTSSGTIQWQKVLGGSNFESGSSIQQTTDGGFILTGGTNSSSSGDVGANHGEADVWVVKLDSDGTIQWQKLLGGSKNEGGVGIQQTSDGGYVLIGQTTSNSSGDVGSNHGSTDFWVVKLDSAGTIQWQKVLGGNNEEYARGIQQTGDGGYILIGYTRSNTTGDVGINHGGSDVWMVKLSSIGMIQWQKVLGGSNNEWGFSINQTSDGGYILIGSTSSNNNGDVGPNHGYQDVWVVKLNGVGTIQWQKVFGGNNVEDGVSIQQTIDGGYIFNGRTYSNNSGDVGSNHGSDDFWVVKLTSAGTIQWQKVLGGSGSELGERIQQTTDGGYILAGPTTLSSNNGDVGLNHGWWDIWVVKLRPDNIPDEIDLTILQSDITFSNPNPLQDTDIEIHTTVRNIGANASQGFVIRFADTTSNSEIANVSIPSLAANSMTTVTLPWHLLCSNTNLTVTIDPDNLIAESNETNNQVTVSSSVGMQQKLLDHLNSDKLDSSHNLYHFYEEFYDYHNANIPPDPVKNSVCDIENDDIWVAWKYPYGLWFMHGNDLTCGLDANVWYSGVDPNSDRLADLNIDLADYVGDDLPDLLKYAEVSVEGNGMPVHGPVYYDWFDNRSEVLAKPEITAETPSLTKMYASGNLDLFYAPKSDTIGWPSDFSQIDAGADVKSFEFEKSKAFNFWIFNLTANATIKGNTGLRAGFKPSSDGGLIPVDAVAPALKVASDVSGDTELIVQDQSLFDSPPTIHASLTPSTPPFMIMEGVIAKRDFKPGESIKSPYELQVNYRNLKASSPVMRFKTSEVVIDTSGTIDFDFKLLPAASKSFSYSTSLFPAYEKVLGSTTITAHSTVNISVYDDKGRYGGSAASSINKQIIPDSNYTESDGGKEIRIPSLIDKFTVLVEGTGTGTYNLTISTPVLLEANGERTISFVDITVTKVATTPSDRDYLSIDMESLNEEIASSMERGVDLDNATAAVVHALDFDRDGIADYTDTNLQFAKMVPSNYPDSVTGQPGEKVNLTARLIFLDQPLTVKTVTFMVGGSSVGSALTNSTGIATIQYTIPKSTDDRVQEISASFPGDSQYMDATGSASLTIRNLPPSVTITSPAPSATVSGIVLINGTIQDTNPASLSLTIDDTEVSTSLPYSWNMTESEYGVHIIELTARDTSGNTASDAIGVLIPINVIPLPGYTNPPTDPDHDSIYEDLNANGRLDFADVVLYFNQMTWIAANEPITAFDLNGNGRIDFADIVALFNEI